MMKNRKVYQVPKLVKVIKCSGAMYWYGDIVGEYRYVIDSPDSENRYVVVSIKTTASTFHINKTIFMLEKTDCEISIKL
jgi:hypothetical protein